jgi:carbonic anhydrase
MVASIESLLSVEAIEKIDPYKRKVSKNQELIAQGVGNSLASMIGGVPLTSVIVRGSVNLSAGARSKSSTIMHGLFLLLSVMFIPTLINMIPISSLAVILFFTGLKLASPKVFKASYKSGFDQFIPFLTTVVVILFTDLLIGILVGLLVSTFFILKEYYTNDSFELIDNGKNKNLVLKETVSFLNKARILEVLESIPSGSSLSVDGSNSNFIDNDILEILEDFKSTATYKNIDFVIGGVKGMSNYVSTYNEVQEAYKKLFNNNDNWVQEKLMEDPDYFNSLSKGQTPSFFCIGCSDSRVTINVITKTDLGQMFVHKNVANLVSPQDMNLMSALQYAVDVLKVKHIIVCGHYGCGGVKAALEGNASGVIENWLSQVRDTYNKHKKELDGIEDKHLKEERLVELNVKEQILNLQKTSIIQNAQKTYGLPLIHGWVYDINTGKIKELDVSKALV